MVTSPQPRTSSRPFDLLRETTSTPPLSSSNIARWVNQLPTPPVRLFLVHEHAWIAADHLPQAHFRPAASEPLAPVSSNLRTSPQHLNRKASTAHSPVKHKVRRANAQSSRPIRRSVRLASLHSKMGRPLGSKNRPKNGTDQEEGQELEPMATASDPTGMPPSTPQRDPSNPYHTAPWLPPTTPSGLSGSPGRSEDQSPSRRGPGRPRGAKSASASTEPKAKPVMTKGQLAQMSPSVFFDGMQGIKDEPVPQPVKDLWHNYIKSAVTDPQVVPLELKASLETDYDTPSKTKGPVANHNYVPHLYTASDLPLVLATVKEIVKESDKNRGLCHHSQWLSKVVTPIMSRIQSLSSSTLGSRGISDLNIESVVISPSELCPTSLAQTFRDLSKKVDNALALTLTKQENQILMKAVTKYRINGAASINQTQNWTAFIPMFQYTELKVDRTDPMIQLAVWVCAEVEKRHREEYALDLPFPLIAISEDYWELWIAYSEEIPLSQRQPGGKSYQIQCLGPQHMGHTANATGVFTILHVLKAIVRWGLEVYEPAFMEHVYQRYA
ncbi:MAG: hypothetical protein Q9206_004498 [Seirophora lacunosa]